MYISLISVDGENEDYEADITTCVLSNNSINILFETDDEGDSVQGRLSIKPINEIQSTKGYWIYPDTQKVKAWFYEKQLESEESKYEAKVSGSLINFRGKSVDFEGKWIDEDGEYDLEINAKIA